MSQQYMEPLSAASCKHTLTENILPFWMSKMVDEEQGGFYGRIDGYNELHANADKGVILNARILWTFSSVYLRLKDPKYLNMAARSFEHLTGHFIDHQYGGVYWMVSRTGDLVDGKKQVYAQAFVIYALAEFYKITRDSKVLDLCVEIFNTIERCSFDQEKNGYLEAFDQKWELLDDLRLSEKDANEAKTMNTHLHVVEAYTNLLSVWQSPVLKKQLKNLIELFLEKFINDQGHFYLFFDENWNLKSHECSYGHDIEGGWLLLDAALVLQDDELIASCKKAAIKLTDAALSGMDEDGGLMNEGNIYGIQDTDKHWWPQAEALVGLMNAYEISGERHYLNYAENTWRFIQQHLIDQECGEWHWMVSRNGLNDRKEDKAGPWKCPYHNGRAMLEVMDRMERIK